MDGVGRPPWPAPHDAAGTLGAVGKGAAEASMVGTATDAAAGERVGEAAHVAVSYRRPPWTFHPTQPPTGVPAPPVASEVPGAGAIEDGTGLLRERHR